MKKGFLIISAFLSLTVLLTSCRDNPDKEVVVKEVKVEKNPDTVVKQREGVLERTAKQVDKKVNEKIDEQIDNIGDDN